MELVKPNKQYHSGRSILYSCQYHIIFCPKYRRKVLVDGIDDRLKALILEKEQEYGYMVLDLEVLPDHVHLLLDADPRIGINAIVGKIKGYTSNRLRTEFPSLKKRLPTLWTRGKFISSVGTVTLETVKQYIDSQKGV